MSEKSVLPWEEALGAATRLNPASGFALCSRWDDEDRVDLADGILPVVRASAERGIVSPLEHLGLLRLAGEDFDISADAVVVLGALLANSPRDRPRLNRAMQTISHWIRRDVPLRQRKAAADRVLAWTEANRQGSLEGVQELRDLSSFVETFPPDPERAERLNLRQEQDQEAEATVQAFLDSARRGDLEDLDEAVRQLRCLTYDSTVDQYLAMLARSLAPSRRIDYLNMLTAMTDDEIENCIRMPAVLTAIASALEAWRNSPSIREWALNGIGTFLKRHLPSVMAYDYNAEAQLEAVLTLPFAEAASRASLLLPAVVEHLDSLSPESLYVLAKALGWSTARSELERALDWSFTRTEAQLGLGAWTPPNAELPDETPKILAMFFLSLFGHYDKRVRWQALHAARYLINLPNGALLDELVRLADTQSVGAFRSSHLEFYWMSARVWLFLLLQRIADEQPILMLRHVDILKQQALSTSLPHAQVRELAKRAALRLAQEDPTCLAAEELERLRRINTPLTCRYPYESPYERGCDDRDFSREGRRYTFDSMDTMPYWFDPLGRVFYQTAQVVAWRAEGWVVESWERTDEAWWDDPRELRDERNARLMSNGHGHVPVLENLRHYLEFHAMQCVAGELIDALPISTSPEEGSWDPWADWLEHHLPASEIRWLSDLRTPTPLDLEYWGQLQPLKAWLESVGPTNFDQALGIGDAQHPDEMVVSSYVDVWDSTRYGTTWVESALVSPDSAHALLRALQTVEEPNDFRLPKEFDTELDDMTIDTPGFELYGWLRDDYEREHLEEHDPLARDVRQGFTTVGSDFGDTMGASTALWSPSCSLPDGTVLAHTEQWSDDPKTEYISEPFSQGRCLWVRRDALLEYLKRKQLDLIIEVRIERRQREGEYGDDTRMWRIYLLRCDGTLEALDGRHRLRRENRP